MTFLMCGPLVWFNFALWLFQGDLVIQCDHLFEFLTKLGVIAKKQNAIKLVQGRWVCIKDKNIEVRFDMCIDLKHLCVFPLIPSIKIEIQPGKESAVDFSTGQEPMVYKAKNGHLMVVRWVLLLIACSCSDLKSLYRQRDTTRIRLFVTAGCHSS